MRKYLGKIKNESKEKEYRRKLTIRKTVIGKENNPRICVTKTNKHLRVQVIDDSKNLTLFSVQTFGKSAVGDSSSKESAIKVGKSIADNLKKNKLDRATFDRSGKLYTGIIKALADSIRENGIKM
jgi:large subunit ribosomal protein L18